MRSGHTLCGPDELTVLQQVFDSVWVQLQQDPAFLFADEAALRDQVSRRVVECASGDLLDMNGIKRKVLTSFSFVA